MKNRKLEGLIKRHPDGFGFFIPDNKDHPDVYIPRHAMNGVMTTDHVEIEVFPERGGERFRGEVTRVLTRGIRQVVGIYTKVNDKYGIIKDESKAWGSDLRINAPDSQGSPEGKMVMAEIIDYPTDDQTFRGRVKEILGSISDPLSDIKRVIFSNHIPYDWPAGISQEIKTLEPNPSEKDFAGRKDLRDLNLITIDGATAKDFDDAVYVENNSRGFRLIVAIADVSHYVRPNTAVDKEAYVRGTSVYFPNFVVPMLPEILSNGLCSLNPHVPRLCLVADMQFDFSGNMFDSDFYEAVMESKARVTYGKAQEVIDGVDLPELRHVQKNILQCADLAKILMNKRFNEGSLNLELPETELEIDSTGTPVDIIYSERLFSHKLIEEMMLAANVAVAKFLSSKEIPAVYRIHEPPPPQALQNLERYLWNFGGQTRLTGNRLQKRLTEALEEFEGRPEAHVLHILTLRSMSQAKYSTNNVGHFGLGFEFYTHFTSPIRRYPDLIVHRLVKSQILRNAAYSVSSEDDLSSAANHLSACEQRSTKAERQIGAIKKARFMEKMVGQEFDGVISSVTKFGIFVLLREYDIDGLVRLEDLSSEKWEYDEENLRLTAKRSGFSYGMGDVVRINVSSVDIQLGQVNFLLAGHTEKKKSAGKEARGQHGRRSGRQQERSRDERPTAYGRKENHNRKHKKRPSGKPGRDRDRDRDHEQNRDQNQDRNQSRGRDRFGGRDRDRDRNPESENRRPRFQEQQPYQGQQTSAGKTGKKSRYDEIMEMDVDASPRSVLKGIKASYRSRENLSGHKSESPRKNAKKRGSATNHRGGVRKARVSQRRRKG